MLSRLALRSGRALRPALRPLRPPLAATYATHAHSASASHSAPSPPPSATPHAPPPPHAEHDTGSLLGLDGLETGPRPEDIPPISERLKPMIPFLIVWSIITSLVVHHLQQRKKVEADTALWAGQESVLHGLIARFEAGEVVPDREIRRELEMVGLRPRTEATADIEALANEMRDVSWWEVLRGRKEQREKREEVGRKIEEGGDQAAVEEWSKIVAEATAPQEHAPVKVVEVKKKPEGEVKRATSANVYL